MSNVKALTECVYEENMLVRMFGTKEEPWFVAVDVLRALGMHTKNVSRTLEKLDSDEKLVVKLTTNPAKKDYETGNPDVWIISEPGLYKIMLTSRTEKAKAFTRWVTHDVLPRIRKYGFYKLTIAEQKTNALNGIMKTLGTTALDKKYYKMTLSDLKREDKFLKNEKSAKEEYEKVKEKYPYTEGDIRAAVNYYKWFDSIMIAFDIKKKKEYCYTLANGECLFSESFEKKARRYVSDPSYEWED